MQGLWKDKRKHYLKDKIKGIYYNSEIIRINNNKIKSDYSLSCVDTRTSHIMESYRVDLVLFRRIHSLSRRFIRRNCASCEYNTYREEEVANKIKDKYKDDNVEYYLFHSRIQNWCKMDLENDYIRNFHKSNYNYKNNLKNSLNKMKEEQGCQKSSKLEFQYEYKQIKVIKKEDGNYIHSKCNKSEFKYLEDGWETIEVIKEGVCQEYKKELFDFVEDKDLSGNKSTVTFKGKMITEEEYTKYFRFNYAQSIHKSNSEIRSFNRVELKKLKNSIDIENFSDTSFKTIKRSYPDYY